ncbi:MAG: GNAT family N-acetyltransferase [Bacillota bacterium]
MGEVTLLELRLGNRQMADEVAGLAESIWTEHYTPIIGAKQVRYMLDRFQSAEKVLEDIAADGYRYFIACDGGKKVGYCAIKPDLESGGLFLSKLYVEKNSRGRGIARMMLEKAISVARENRLGHIWLTVNKRNVNSIEIYKRLGFVIVEELVKDIGEGFVMDDYKMRMEIE